MEIEIFRNEKLGISAYDTASIIKWNMLQELRRKWNMISSTEHYLSFPEGWFKIVEKESYYDLYLKDKLIQEKIDNIDETNEITFRYLETRRLESKEMISFFISLDK